MPTLTVSAKSKEVTFRLDSKPPLLCTLDLSKCDGLDDKAERVEQVTGELIQEWHPDAVVLSMGQGGSLNAKNAFRFGVLAGLAAAVARQRGLPVDFT